MKVIITFDVNWEDYGDVCDELIVEDMFNHTQMKDGVSIESVKIERT